MGRDRLAAPVKAAQPVEQYDGDVELPEQGFEWNEMQAAG
jgi:hypothetical protein